MSVEPIAVTVYSRQTVNIHLYVKYNYLEDHMNNLFPLHASIFCL